MKRSLLLLFILLLLINLPGCDEDKKRAVTFSYNAIINKEFRYNIGRVIPLTIEQSIETDGDISRDAKFFYYSSNRANGNYDIYLRELNNITTVRITSHAAKDTSPVISPDGENLAFVSNREDPEGDIYIVDINPEKLIRRSKRSVARIPSLDDDAENLTQHQDPLSKTIMIVKDSSPVWSPDGKRIAYSSKKGGSENIWIMDPSGKNKRQITSKGGMYPGFSPDGKKITFISYRDMGSGGDVYFVDLKTLKETRLTSTPGIELYPVYAGSNKEIIYTLIDRDTNKNGKLDLMDNSVLYYRNLKTKTSYALTLYSKSSFNAKWLSLYKTKMYKGLLLYSDQMGENININIIPDTGIIPKKPNAKAQYLLAKKYLQEFGDTEKHLLALEMVHLFFGHRRDKSSEIYTGRALVDLAKQHLKKGDMAKVKKISATLGKSATKKRLYTRTQINYINAVIKGRNKISEIKKSIRTAEKNDKDKYYIPYLMEDLADEYYSKHNRKLAIKTYSQIYERYRDDKKLRVWLKGIYYKYARSIEINPERGLHPMVLLSLKESISYEKVIITKRLLRAFEKEKNLNRRIRQLEGLGKKCHDQKYLIPLLHYSQAVAEFELGDFSSSEKNLKIAIKKSRRTELVNYRSNLLMGDIALKGKKLKSAEKYYSAGVTSYRTIWKEKDYIKRVKWLIDYYETYGLRSEYSGNMREAVSLYNKYTSLLSFLHRIKRFEDIYDQYGPRAHVLYIDANARLKGESPLDSLEESYVKGLPMARMDFDKAFIFGLGYLYTQKALNQESKTGVEGPGEHIGLKGLLENFREAMMHIDWAIFIDDTFINPYLLKSWIYQYTDIRRDQAEGNNDRLIGKYFPKYLWEMNIELLERALISNDETINSETEGNIHLNMGNNFFLLLNYPEALSHYKKALVYKKNFKSGIMEALFHYHLGYCYWQNGELDSGREEINKSLYIYESLSSGKNIKRFKNQLYLLYKYFALFNRFEGNYEDAIKWYQKILDFTASERIKIDRARYMQEIAYCYRESGDLDRAINYLNRADRLLKTYPDDEKTYKLKVRLFEIFPFSFYDLGPDTAVVGENKIFSSLDTRSKKLLNIALEEEIYSENGNYSKAMKYLEKKISLLKDRETQVDYETLITTYNNLGYYSYRSGQYLKAKEYFNRAWDFASDPKVKNLDGTFTAIMNLSNLYAFLLEYSPEVLKNPGNEISSLITKISSYRENYEKGKYETDLKNLEKEAEASKKKVSEGEKLELREEISEKAGEIYYKIDIALGVLKYYRAELLFNERINIPGQEASSAYTLYNNNKKIYAIYNEALQRFENALDIAENSGNKKLYIKLLLNTGSCYTKTGAIKKAYGAYLEAMEIADANRYSQLQLKICYKLGNFLKDHGKEVEGKEHLAAATDYYARAKTMVEASPLLFSSNLKLIENLYDQYTAALILRGKWKKAFHVSEKKHDVTKVILVYLSSPDFSNEKDMELYISYIDSVKKTDKTGEAISDALAHGETPESPKIKSLEKSMSEERKKMGDILLQIRRKSPLLAQTALPVKSDITIPDNTTVVKLFNLKGTIYAWEIRNNRLSFKNITDNTTDIAASISSYFSKYKKEKLFLVLNSSLLEIFDSHGKIENMPSLMFTPSISGIKYFMKGISSSIKSVYCSGAGLKEFMDSTGIKVDQGGGKRPDLSSYSVIVDMASKKMIEPSTLFNSHIKPVSYTHLRAHET